MMANDWKDRAKRLQGCANALSDDGMLAHEFPFLRGKAGRLQNDRIGNRYLSDVVNHTRAPESGNLLFRKLQMLSQRSRILRQTFAMTVRVGIFSLNASGKGEQ